MLLESFSLIDVYSIYCIVTGLVLTVEIKNNNNFFVLYFYCYFYSILLYATLCYFYCYFYYYLCLFLLFISTLLI